MQNTRPVASLGLQYNTLALRWLSDFQNVNHAFLLQYYSKMSSVSVSGRHSHTESDRTEAKISEKSHEVFRRKYVLSGHVHCCIIPY